MYGDSDEDEEKVEEPLPPHEVRSTDMIEDLQAKWIRCNYTLSNRHMLI